MTGFQSKQAAAQAKLTEDDDIQDYKRPWVGLTDEEIDRVTDAQWSKGVNKPIYAAHRAYARAIEQALKEKNN